MSDFKPGDCNTETQYVLMLLARGGLSAFGVSTATAMVSVFKSEYLKGDSEFFIGLIGNTRQSVI